MMILFWWVFLFLILCSVLMFLVSLFLCIVFGWCMLMLLDVWVIWLVLVVLFGRLMSGLLRMMMGICLFVVSVCCWCFIFGLVIC